MTKTYAIKQLIRQLSQDVFNTMVAFRLLRYIFFSILLQVARCTKFSGSTGFKKEGSAHVRTLDRVRARARALQQTLGTATTQSQRHILITKSPSK